MAVALRGRNRHRASQLPPAIGAVKRSIEDDLAAARTSRELAGRRLELLDDLAEQEAKGAISREAVDAKLAEADRESAAHVRNAEARERAAEVRERELAALEQEFAKIGVEARLDELAAVIKTQDEATAQTKRTLTAAAKAASELAEARERTAALDAELRRELGDIDTTWPDPPVELDLIYTTRLVADNSSLSESLSSGKKLVMFSWPAYSHLPHAIAFRGGLGELVDALITGNP